MSDCEEECEDNLRRRQSVEDMERIIGQDKDIEVVRMVTECLERYNNYTENNDGINAGEDAP